MSTPEIGRVLLVTPSFSGGGAERVIVWLAQRWSLLANHVFLVSIAGESTDDYAIPDSVQHIALGLDDNSANALAGLLANAQRVYRLRQCIKAYAPDLVISFQASANITTVLATRGTGVPVVIAERNYTPLIPLGRVWIFLRDKSYRWASEVVSQTEEGAGWLRQELGCQNVSVIPNAVNHPIPPQPPERMPEDYVERSVPVVLAAGRLSHAKGFDKLVQAYELVLKQCPDWKLIILGGGNSNALEAQIVNAGLAHSVIVVGRVGNLADWYERAQLFVLSSRREGFPNVLVEAMSYGLPVVSTLCKTGPADIITEGVNGRLVPVDDPVELANAMIKLMQNEAERRRLSGAAVGVINRYCADSVFAQWQALAARVIAR